ncbi:MAG: discoidin domain-containing protein, partial [Rhodanobacteraceae bacterium]
MGGLNVAWSALGAKSLDNHPQLIDGLANYGSSVEMGVDKAGRALEIALAGSSAVRLVGFALVPAPWESVGRRVRGFRILASADGTNFTPVVSGRMSPRDDTQYFVLPKAIDARFLKLVLLDAQYSQSPSIALGDFQAIADPASAPLGEAGLEISPLLRGGHVVLSDPYPYYNGAMLSDDKKMSSGVGIPADHKGPVSWVVGFLDDRPARVNRIDWRYSPNESGYSAIPSVDVYSSMISPDGPWTKLGTWRIALTGDSAPFRPPSAPLVRYLRFVAAATKGGVMAAANKSGSAADLPEHLSVHEIPASKNYHSVLSLAAQTDNVRAQTPSGSSAART